MAAVLGHGSGWWGAVTAEGLDSLSPPELERALDELVLERTSFLRILQGASGWPKHSIMGWRRADPAAIRRLDRSLPRGRALVAPEDEAAIAVALDCFDTVLVLDPFWPVRDLLYDAWHNPAGLTQRHALQLSAMLAPAVRLQPLAASGRVHFVPDTLPGSWEPWPLKPTVPTNAPATVRAAYALHRAARLVYWSTQLRSVAVATLPGLVEPLRNLLACGPDLQAARTELTVRVSKGRFGATSGWADVFDRQARRRHPDLEALAAGLGLAAAGTACRLPWHLGWASRELPAVSLALRRTFEGRPLRSGSAGEPIVLRRGPVYLVPHLRLHEGSQGK